MKQENLNPEIEEKLLQLQRYQQEKHVKKDGTSVPVVHTPVSTPAAKPTPVTKPTPARKRPAAAHHDQGSNETPTPKRKVQKVDHKEAK